MLRILCLLLIIAGPAWAEDRVPQSQSEISLSFAPLVRQAAPAVVNIYARRVVQTQSPFQNEPVFGRLFKGSGSGRPQTQNSLGSGVVLSADGIIVSNYHVVGQATEIRVVLSNRKELSAHVLLADEESDLAILQLEGASDMPHLMLRDSETVDVGELVLAIGNPFGVGQTVSSGIVSGLARTGTATGNARGYFIQTDASINPGNSGGALIDVGGRLIGINTSILTRSGGSNGIGFAIPADLVAQFMVQAREGNTRFDRPWAGLSGQAVDGDLSEGLGLDVPGGVVITQLHPASPFSEAGLRSGDVILTVDGQFVHTPAEALYRMSVRGVGAQALVRYSSQGRISEVSVAMIRPPESPARDAVILSERTPLPGLAIAQANPAVISELGLSPGTEGIVITDPGPYGARVGLQTGDVLVGISGQPVETTAGVGRLLTKSAPRIQIEARRGGQRLLLRFRL